MNLKVVRYLWIVIEQVLLIIVTISDRILDSHLRKIGYYFWALFGESRLSINLLESLTNYILKSSFSTPDSYFFKHHTSCGTALIKDLGISNVYFEHLSSYGHCKFFVFLVQEIFRKRIDIICVKECAWKWWCLFKGAWDVLPITLRCREIIE